MRILILTSKHLFSLMNTERFELYSALIELSGAELLFIEDINQAEFHFNKYEIVIIEEPIWIIKFKLKYDVKRIKKAGCYKVTFLTDFFQSSWQQLRIIQRLNIDHVFCAHEIGEQFCQRNLRRYAVTSSYLPFSIREEDYRHEAPKDIDILFAGGNKTLQPVRCQIADVCREFFSDHLYEIAHPGYRVNAADKSPTGKDFIELLKRSHFVVTCTSKFRISIRKYWEIGAAAATPIGDSTFLQEHSLVQKNLVKVVSGSDKAEIKNTIQRAIDRKISYSKVAKKLSSEYLSTYGNKYVALRMLTYLENAMQSNDLYSKIYKNIPQHYIMKVK